MRICCGIKGIKRLKLKNPVVTIGTFDGVHLGHQRLLKKVVERAGKIKGESLVITFDPHPQKILKGKDSPPSLISLEHRLNLIADEGIDYALVINFRKSFANLNARDFFKRVLVEAIGARELVLAPNFRFGHSRKGTVKRLEAIAQNCGIKIYQIRLVKISGAVVSSTDIRNLIRTGRLLPAQRRLGRPVSVLGTVKRGDALGRKLGFPTANIDPHHEVVPPAGVYAVLALVNNRRLKGVVNIGFRPTISKGVRAAKDPRVELHLFDFRGNLYNSLILMEFVKRIRPEKHFKDLNHLGNNISKDVINAKRILLYK